MKALLSLIISGALVVSGYSQTRNVLVGTNNAVVQPTNFWSADASNARTGLGLGSAATNPASAFQPSSTTLSNLSIGNGAGLTNVTASSVSSALAISNTAGLQAALDGKLATNGSAAGLISFPTVVLQTNSSLSLFPEGLLRTNGNALGLTNFPVIPVTSGGTGGTNAQTARNGIGLGITNTLTIAGVVAQNLTIESGGGITLQAVLTNAASFRTNVGLPWTGLTNTDAASFRTALGLGTAATNPSSAFQPASSALTNLVSGNGGALTNLQATNLVGIIPASNISTVTLSNIGGTLPVAQGGTGATNASAARVNLGSTTVGDAVFIATNDASARTAIGATTVGSSLFTLANPSAITFLRLNADNTASALSAADFRTALSLGTAATNPSSAFQPASSALTNLSTNNGVSLTNIPVAGVVGALSTNGNGAGLTNLTAANITGTVALASNVNGTIAISNGGSGATTAGGARTNLGLGATNNAFVAISVGTQNTNLSTNDTSLFGQQNYADTTVSESFAFGGANKITNMPAGSGGSIVMGILGNMTNQGAFLFNGVPQGGTVGNSRGNNTFAVNASNGIYLNGLLFLEAVQGGLTDTGILQIAAGGSVTRTMTNKSTAVPAFFGWDGFVNTAFSAAQARTNIGLSFAALTNTNTAGFNASLYGSGTNPVLVNSNSEVVSPTNFWQAAPINTVLQNITNVVGNATNAATNARMLFLYSLAPTVTNITSTITLPTNGSTFGGDVATITHLGPTSSVTAIRALGASTNIITLNQIEESVRFIYRDNQWKLMDNISYIEPIFFSGTNAAANAAESRTNLGLGATWLTNTNVTNFRSAVGLGATNEVSFDDIQINESGEGPVFVKNESGAIQLAVGTNETSVLSISDIVALFNVHLDWANTTNAAITRTNLGLGATNNVTFSNVAASGTLTSTGVVTAVTNLNVGGAIAVTNAALTRTNLGLPLDALTNTSVTNFQKAIFYTNTAPSNIGGNLGTIAAWIEIVASNGVTYKIPAYTDVP